MNIDMFRDQTLEAMSTYMSLLSQRQQVVASNIANIDTPGYKTADVSFHATMEELLLEPSPSLRVTRPEHNEEGMSASPQFQAFEVHGQTSRADHNNVDLDKEMMKLSETSFGYSVMTDLLRTKFHTIASSINEGRV